MIVSYLALNIFTIEGFVLGLLTELFGDSFKYLYVLDMLWLFMLIAVLLSSVIDMTRDEVVRKEDKKR